MSTTKTYLDKPSLWVAVITAVLILIIVTVGVLVRFFIDELAARVTLISLIILLSILGLCALTFLELRKRKVQKTDKTAVKNAYLYNNLQPSAPRDPNWEYSNRSTVPA